MARAERLGQARSFSKKPSDKLSAAQETLTYTYSSGSWGDQLTSVGGWTYAYDAIGNPISKTKTNGESVTFTWSGRELTSWCLYDDGELVNPMSFTYNADGIRTSKSYYDEVTEYILDGTRIVAEVKGSNVFVYIYDELGLPVGIKYRAANSTAYEYFFFEKNLQGDIVAIYNDSGTKIASYVYDAWGNFTKTQTSGVTYSAADTFVYNNNPFTYRGYYYDAETGLYYLQTRYYDPQIGRFISADGYVSTGQGLLGYNMYAYCGNNPVALLDETGEFPWLIIGFLVVCAVIGGIYGAMSDKKLYGYEEKDSVDFEGEQGIEEEGFIDSEEELTIKDRIVNTIIGASMGLVVGGGLIATYGIAGSLGLGSATTASSVFGGMTGVQTFALGSLVLDLVAFVFGPIFGFTVEPIEYEPSPVQYSNPVN